MEYFCLPFKSQIDTFYYCIKLSQIDTLGAIVWTQPACVLNNRSVFFQQYYSQPVSPFPDQ